MDIEGIGKVQEEIDAGVVVHVADVSGVPLFYADEKPVTITVAGKYSKAYQEATFAQARVLRRRGTIPIPPEEQLSLSIQFVAACILSWDGFTSGEHICPLSKETATALLTVAPWIREQLETAMFDRRVG